MLCVPALTKLSLVALLAVTLGAPVAWAEEEAPADPAVALLERLVALSKADDYAGLAAAMEEVGAIYEATENEGVRGKLRAEMGKVARDKKAGEARLPAITALVGLDDPKGAWKELSKLMPKGKEEEATEIDLAVVVAAGTTAQSKSVKGLQELAMKAKDAALASAAAKALGGFRQDKRNRVKILEELIKVGQRTRPGSTTDKAASPESRERWAKVERGVIDGLNGLTGRSIADFAGWELLWKDNKKQPRAIFLDEDDE